MNMDCRQLKALARRADRAKGKERKRLVERLVREPPKLDPFEGYDEFTIWLAKLVARVKWGEAVGAGAASQVSHEARLQGWEAGVGDTEEPVIVYALVCI